MRNAVVVVVDIADMPEADVDFGFLDVDLPDLRTRRSHFVVAGFCCP